MSTLLRALGTGKDKEEELGGQMSFLEHLDELRKRLIRSLGFVFIAAMLCWFAFRSHLLLFSPCLSNARWPKRNVGRSRSMV